MTQTQNAESAPTPNVAPAPKDQARMAWDSLTIEQRYALHVASLNAINQHAGATERCKAYHQTIMATLRSAFAVVMRNAVMIPGVPLDAVKEARDFERALKTL